MRTIRASCVLAAVVLLVSCTAHKTTIVTTDGTATMSTTDDSKTTTVQSKDGEVKVGENAVDTSKLGAPIYPGATASDSGGVSVNSDKGTGDMVAFKTSDPFDKVYEFYKRQMPKDSEKMKFAQGDSSMATFQIGQDADAENTSVMITAKAGETDILITHRTKKAGG